MAPEALRGQTANAGFRTQQPEGFLGNPRRRYAEQFDAGHRRADAVAAARTALADAAPSQYKPPIDTNPGRPIQHQPVGENVLAGVDTNVQRKINEEVWAARRKRDAEQRLARRVDQVNSGKLDIAAAAGQLGIAPADMAVAVFTSELDAKNEKGTVTIAVQNNNTVPEGLRNVQVFNQQTSDNATELTVADILRDSLPENEDPTEAIGAAVSRARRGVLDLPESWDSVPDEIGGARLRIITDQNGRRRALTFDRELAPTG